MEAKEVDRWWDPYETCHRRQFVFRPNSAADVLLCPVSTSSIESSSRSGPFGSTVYHKEFSWKAACRPECIHTGQRRNNPHPSQSFLTWRLPRDATQNPEYVRLPWKCLPSEGEIHKALTALYRSTYRCDFPSGPQGCDLVNNGERRPAPLHSRRHVTRFPDTEMRDNYRQPKPKPELMGHRSLMSCNTDPIGTRRGIVPTVVQWHVQTQQRGSDLTAYDRFCGKRVTNVASVVRSLLPQELQRLHRTLPAGGKEAVKTVMSRDAYPNVGEKENKLPALVLESCSPERISSWPGPG
ncbi:testis-expressed protein 26 [Pleuronectes platessa]|uniref:testis-expressed protein 26 n=1 Tax=Pleuronectes platessa TaxID=8262 RepID=UPI00232A5C87|nr:testis-expressed protein 26 [Pleuronectes platessa]